MRATVIGSSADDAIVPRWVSNRPGEDDAAVRSRGEDPRHGRNRVPRLRARAARSRGVCRRVEVRDTTAVSSSSRALPRRRHPHRLPAGRRRRTGDRGRRLGERRPGGGGGRRTARPRLDRRRLRRPQGRPVRRGRRPFARAPAYGRAKADAETRGRQRPPEAPDRADIADRRRPGAPAVEARARRARSHGHLLRRGRSARPVQVGDLAAALLELAALDLAGPSTSQAPTTSRGPISPSSSPGVPCAALRRRRAGRSTARSTRRARGRCSARSCGACVPSSHEPPRRRDQPVPAPARRQPGRLVPVGRRGASRAARERRPADPALDRLLAPATGAT